MRVRFAFALLAASLGLAPPLTAQSHDHAADSAFDALQERGRLGMGVDQNASMHVFDALPDGGRVELQMREADPEGVERIRTHLHQIAQAFRQGDFRVPGFIHAKDVPGTSVMRAKKDRIRYAVRKLPRGAELRITTKDPEVVAALTEFMAFQRQEHRTGGRAH